MTFRETPVTDASAHALLAEYFAYRAQTFPNPAGYVTKYPEPEQFVRPEGVFLVVELDGTDVGCGGIRWLGFEQFGQLRFEVKHLWLRPSAQGRGLGRALLAELERLAVELGATDLVLDTNASLEAAGGLYRSSGFVDTEPYNDNPNATNWYRKVLVDPERMHTLAALWWASDGASPAFDRVFHIVHDEHALVPQLISALAHTAPEGALGYIGTSVVEDLSIQVQSGGIAGAEALQLILDSGLAPSTLFSILSGAYGDQLEPLDRLQGLSLSASQRAWLLNERSPNRRPRAGESFVDGDGIGFDPHETPWQAELEERHAKRTDH